MYEERIAGILVLPVADQRGETVAERGRQSERLAHLSRRAPSAIGDDVGGHGRAQASVALVDVLDDLLAPITARQVEVDVGPLPALLGKEALEEQLHAHRIHRGDAQRVADRAIGGGAASLHQDVVMTAVLDQVPHDEEVAREVEAADELELVLDLMPGALRERSRAVADLGAPLAQHAEKSDGSLAGRQRELGEAIAEVLEGEAQAQGELAAIGHRGRAIGKEPLHFLRRLEEPLAIAREEPARLLEGDAVTDAGERVQERPLPALRHEGRVAGEEQEPAALRFRAQPLVLRLVLAIQIALELGVDVEATEEPHEPVEGAARRFVALAREAMGYRPLRAPRQADEAARVRLEVVPARGAFALGRAHLDPREEAAEIAIALGILHKEGQAAAVPQAHLGAH